MFDDKGHIRVAALCGADQVEQIDAAVAGAGLAQVEGIFPFQPDVLEVAALDERPKLFKAFVDEFLIKEIALRRCYPVEHIQMHRKAVAADVLEQAQVLVRSGRVHPGHRLDRKVCILRVYGVDELADGLHAELPGLAGEVLLIGAVPAGPARAEDVDAAARADAVGQFQLTDRVADRRLTPVLVGVQHVAPHADFGNRQAVRLRRGDCCVDEGGVVPTGQVKVDGLQAQALLALRPVFRRGVRERG